MRLNDAAHAIRVKLSQRNACDLVQVFVNILTGSILWADASASLAGVYRASPLHVMVGTYDRNATERRIHGDLMEAQEDAVIRRAAAPIVVHTNARGEWA